MEDLHSLENSGTIVGDCDVTLVVLDHFIHTLGTKGGSDSVCNGLGGFNVGHSDLRRFTIMILEINTYMSWLLLVLEGSFSKFADWRLGRCCCVSGGHL